MAKEGVENLVGKGQEVAGRVQEGAMAAVDRVNDFVCNVSDSLNGSACANATMNGTEMANDTIGETIDEDGEDATGEDAAGEEAGDDGRRKLLDLTDAAGAVSDAAGTVTDAVTGAVSGDGMMTDMNATDMNATDMNATMNGTMMMAQRWQMIPSEERPETILLPVTMREPLTTTVELEMIAEKATTVAESCQRSESCLHK